MLENVPERCPKMVPANLMSELLSWWSSGMKNFLLPACFSSISMSFVIYYLYQNNQGGT